MKIGIGVGSNLGDRGGEIAAAFDFLRTLDRDVRVSAIYESKPQDCPSGSGLFLNAAAVMNWKGGLFSLLDRFQQFESDRGRPGIRTVNAPRPLDLDILFCDDLVLFTPRLILPHPRLAGRHFVLRPLAELEPDYVVPGGSVTVQTLCLRFEKGNPEDLCQPIASR